MSPILPMIERGLISIVIPTYRRAASLREATLSAVAQTYSQVEVIVVSDGPDPPARAAVAGLGERVRYFELQQSAGPASARNFGIQQSRGEWITFLDDDDLMLPQRLERQAVDLDGDNPALMSACQLIYRRQVRTTAGNLRQLDDIWPSRPIEPDENLGDYLLIRPSLLGRPGVVSLQALIVHHTIARQVPMPTHPEHEDWAWLLDVWHLAGARIRFFWEPLVVYRIDTSTESRSRRCNWTDSLQFALQYRRWLSERAFNAFLSSKVLLKARRAGDWAAVRQVYALLRANDASLLHYMYFIGLCVAPLNVAQSLWKLSLHNGYAGLQSRR